VDRSSSHPATFRNRSFVDGGHYRRAVDIGGIVLTAAGTLATSALVQVFVVPRAQAWTRGRERWERDMEDLAALLEEQLPRALDGYQSAGSLVRLVRGMERADALRYSGYNPDTAREIVERLSNDRREANAAVGREMGDLKKLIGRARRLNRDAQYWRDLENGRTTLRVALLMVNHDGSEDPNQVSDGEWDRAWDAVTRACESLLAMVNEVTGTHPMKPPARPGGLLQRFKPRTLAATAAVFVAVGSLFSIAALVLVLIRR
jgi:hypothetical protein